MAQFRLTPQIILEPYAVQLSLSLPTRNSAVSVEKAAVGLIQELARRCDNEEGALIGHIKGFALGQNQDWLKISLTDSRRPVETEGSLSTPFGPVRFTLNAHVIGLTKDRIKTLVDASIQKLVEDLSVNISRIDKGISENGS